MYKNIHNYCKGEVYQLQFFATCGATMLYMLQAETVTVTHITTSICVRQNSYTAG